MSAPKRSKTVASPVKSERSIMGAWVRETRALTFGPAFFLTQLADFVLDRCPTPANGLPVVLVHLVDDEVLDVCHVIGLSRRWVALAVHDERGVPGPPRMCTVVVPYASICRLTLRAEAGDGVRIGFRQESDPKTFTAGTGEATSDERALALGAVRRAPVPEPHRGVVPYSGGLPPRPAAERAGGMRASRMPSRPHAGIEDSR